MIAKKPPMGWNTWNTFGDKINEQLIRETADVLANEGYLEAGYEYLVIDDCWSLRERDAQGRLVADPAKFPNGMKAVADYVHSKGLKFGMYSCAGVRTCAGYPGSYDHEFVDAATFAEWGVDYLKYDYCNFPETADGKRAYHTMSMALKASGREILFAACNWGSDEPGRWMKSIGAHMYRSTGDIMDNFRSFIDIAKSQLGHFCESGSGCFNDIDMLTVGMYNKGNVAFGKPCTDDEYAMQFSLWCLMGAPLMMGADIRSLTPESKKLLLNKELIAVDQDEELRPPFIVKRGGVTVLDPNPEPGKSQWVTIDDTAYTFIKHLSNNEFVLAYYNLSEHPSEISCIFADAGLPYTSGYGFELTDLFSGEKIGVVRDYYNPYMQPHTCRLFKAKLVKC